MSALRSIHFPPPDLTPAPAETPPPAAKEYLRPDIVLLGSIRGASDQIREELRLIGDEQNYHTALLVLKTQGRLIGDLAEELLRRFDEAALLIQQRAQKP